MTDANRSELLYLTPVLVVSLLLNVTGLWWGLPDGDTTWAVDALVPTTPLAVVHRLLSGGWNSGWFYYKYPLGHSLLLAAIYAPYMLWLALTGGLGRVVSHYPYGFADPEQALLVLGVLGRSVSALLTTAATLVWYWTCREAFPRRTAWLAAWFFATLFPIVYYAHTTTVDAPMVFWSVLALYGAARVCHRTHDRAGMVLCGGAGAMALATKESAFGLVVTLPLIMLVEQVRRRWRTPGRARLLPPGTLRGCAIAVVVFALMSGALINPSGVWHRVHFLTRGMPEAVQLQYSPRFSHVGSVAPKRLATELAHIGKTLRTVAASLGWPLAIAATIGAMAYGWRRPGAFFVCVAAGYYVLSVRTFELLRARYVMPLSIVGCVLAACTLDWAARRMPGALGRRLMAVLLVLFVIYSGARGVDATRLLYDDSRYAAEQWLRANALPGATIEVYQRPAYLPRFASSARPVRIAFDHISIPDFRSRQPDLVVLSSAGLAGVTTRYRSELGVDERDGHTDRAVSWRRATGEAIAFEYARNRAFVDALEGGCLGYGLAAHFETPPWLAEPTIGSLAPNIRIYRRRTPELAPETDTADALHCRRLLGVE